MRDASIPEDLRQLSHCDVTAKCYSRYDINGFRFRTAKLEASRPLAATSNSGVVTTSSNAIGEVRDYFGILQNIIEYTFGGHKEGLKVVFFDCIWFDPINGTRVDEFGMVEVKHGSRLQGYMNNFVLAHQAEQVYYLSYPHPSMKAWWVVFRVNPQVRPPGVDDYKESIQEADNLDIYQEEDIGDCFPVTDGVGLSQLRTDDLELIPEEAAASKKRARKSVRIARIQQRNNQIRVAEAESDADDF